MRFIRISSSLALVIAAGKTVNLVFQNTTFGGATCPSTGIDSNGNVGSNCAMPVWMWTALSK